MDKAQQAYQYFLSQGYSPELASAIVGNLVHESNLNTSAEGDKGFKGGSSFGIAQWRGERLDRLKKYAGEKWTDFNKQLEFVDWELNNTHKGAKNRLVNARDVHEAGEAFSDYYEIPQKKYKQDQRRQKNVEQIYTKFSGQPLTVKEEEVNTIPIYQIDPQLEYNNWISKFEEPVEQEQVLEDVQQLNEISFLDDLLSNMPELTYVAPDPILVGGAQEVFQSGGTRKNFELKKEVFTQSQDKFEKVKKHFGLSKNHTMYGFKHTIVTKLMNAGHKHLDVMQLTGHKTIKAFEEYLRNYTLENQADLGGAIDNITNR